MATKVLIVEDDEALAYIFAHYMEEIGIASDLAKNGQEAIEISATNKYDLILMDIHMPFMNGIEATNKIVSLMPETVVVAVTSSDDKFEFRQMRAAGAKDFLVKPLTAEKLLLTVARYFPIISI